MTTRNASAPVTGYRQRPRPPPPQSPPPPPQPQEEQRSAEQAAFEYLNNVLSNTSTSPLEIEILPPALQDDEFAIKVIENCIGIPQRLLVFAFLYAKLLFFRGIPQLVQQGLPATERIQLSMSATQIMLLYDPEYLTAANARKRILTDLLETSSGFSGTPSTSLIDEYIRKELWLLDSLQTSPLPKHMKSSTLWYHRRWLMDEFLEWVLDVQRVDVLGSKRMSILVSSPPLSGGSASAGPGASTPIMDATDVLWRSFVEPELRVIGRSGERHQSNYAAWDFARHLIDTISDYAYLRSGDRDMTFTPGSPSSQGSAGWRDDIDPERLVKSTVDLAKTWCMSHLSDASGWSFFLWLMGRLTRGGNEEMISRCFVEVGNMAIAIRARQEPVWNFIRILLASEIYLYGQFRVNFVNDLWGWLDQEFEAKRKKEMSGHIGQGTDVPDELFDLVMHHLKWVKSNWQGQPRPPMFGPVKHPYSSPSPQIGPSIAESDAELEAEAAQTWKFF